MLTIIFGAGASYDSKPVHSIVNSEFSGWQPPLTKDLFDSKKIWCNEADRYSTTFDDKLKPVVEQIRRQTEFQGLEFALENLRAEREVNGERWGQEILIRVWIYNVIRRCSEKWLKGLNGVTTYLDLFQRLDLWQRKSGLKTNIVSFNYDTLLEEAAFRYQSKVIPQADFNKYVSGQFFIFKPHGSTNWIHKIKFDPSRKSLFDDGPLIESEKKNTLLFNNSNHALGVTFQEAASGGKVYANIPAIAIPVTNKNDDDFVLPPGHKEKMIEAIRETTRILVIGWAGNEKHFLKLLESHLRDGVSVLLVCGRAEANTVSNIHESMKNPKFHETRMGFADFLNRTMMLENFLENSSIQLD